MRRNHAPESVAATRGNSRGSSGVQRRRAPVWITSSRDTFDIVVCSVIRLCLRGFIPQRKAAVAGGLPSTDPAAIFNPREGKRRRSRHFQERMPYGLFLPDVPDATAYTLNGSESV